MSLAIQMYAQDHNDTIPGALTWTSGQISSSHTKWASDAEISGGVLHCIDSNSSMPYGMAVALAGGNMKTFSAANPADVLLTADASVIVGSVPPVADGLLCSLADIDANRHIYRQMFRHGHARFMASFLDGHVMMIYPNSVKPADEYGSELYAIMNDAIDATFVPSSQRASDLLFQGADNLFIVNGEKATVSGKSFTSAHAGRTHYFAFYYASLPKNGQGITIAAPGGPVTLIRPTKGKYYTIFVRPVDEKHKIAAKLNGSLLTISNNTQ